MSENGGAFGSRLACNQSLALVQYLRELRERPTESERRSSARAASGRARGGAVRGEVLTCEPAKSPKEQSAKTSGLVHFYTGHDPSFLTRTSTYLARIAELCVPPASVWSSYPRRSIV